MRKSLLIGISLCVMWFSLAAQTNSVPAPATSSIAVSIVYDGSGSMKERVPAADNQNRPKYQIANKAVNSIIKQLLAYSQDKHVNVEAGLVYFVNSKIHQGIPLAALTPERGATFDKWTDDFKNPTGGTPLGQAIEAAQKQLSESHNIRKHILVITDGVSNSGITPEKAVHALRTSDSPIPVYFVAFDISANVFDAVKAEGATVVSASNEAELNVQINAILGKKILLEAE